MKGKLANIKARDDIKGLVADIRDQHSKKPEEVRRRIVLMCKDLPKIELFARHKTEGWDVWGNEVNND
jgi:site-specific DNA-methyltransferase (adenine-specific)